MEERYNVYFAGQVMDGYDPHSVRDKLAKMFNADQQTLDKLFSGKTQLIKRDCDKATALKFKEAMERAGAQPTIKVAASQTAEAKAEPTRTMTRAEKIAALAAAPDEDRYQKPALESRSSERHTDAGAEAGGISLAPPGTEVLRENERAERLIREVDTAGLEVDTAAKRLSEEAPVPPAAPDTRHISMGEVGETIPHLPSGVVPVSPNIDGLALSAPGTDFSDCAPLEAQALPLDLSALSLEPPGTDLLEEQYRGRKSGAAPSTDHISLED